MKTVSLWFPANERGLAAGIYNIGASFGGVLAPGIVAFAVVNYSWQTAFLITGALGLLWTVIWLFFYRDPDKNTALSDRERQHIAAGQEKHLLSDGRQAILLRDHPPAEFLGHRSAAPSRGSDLGGAHALASALFPRTCTTSTSSSSRFFVWMPLLAADLGCLFGPFVIAMLQRAGISLVNARRGTFTLGAFLMIAVAFTGFVKDPYTALALLCVAGFAHQTLSVTVITMATDLFKRNEVATVAGMAGTFGNAGVLAFSTAVGALVLIIGYTPFFVALAVLDLVGATVLWTLVRPPQPEPARA